MNDETTMIERADLMRASAAAATVAGKEAAQRVLFGVALFGAALLLVRAAMQEIECASGDDREGA